MFLLKWQIYVYFLQNEIQKLFGDTQMCCDTMVENHCTKVSLYEECVKKNTQAETYLVTLVLTKFDILFLYLGMILFHRLKPVCLQKPEVPISPTF